jgi:hypothetical protein
MSKKEKQSVELLEVENLHLSKPVEAQQPLLRLLRHLKHNKLHLIGAVASSTANKVFDLGMLAWRF